MKRRQLPYPEAVPLPSHYRVEAKLGFRPVLHCVCGASIEFSQATNSRPTREMVAFREEHQGCMPQEAHLER